MSALSMKSLRSGGVPQQQPQAPQQQQQQAPQRVYNDRDALFFYSQFCPICMDFMQRFALPKHWIQICVDFREMDKRGNWHVYIPATNSMMELPVVVNAVPCLWLPNDAQSASFSDAQEIYSAFPQYFNPQTQREVNPQTQVQQPSMTSTGRTGIYVPPNATHPGGAAGAQYERFGTGRATEADIKRNNDAYNNDVADLLEAQRQRVRSNPMQPPGPRIQPANPHR